MTSIVFDKKDYTWRDKEYYKLYQRELYVKRLGLKCMCQNCGSITTNKNLKTHQKTDKCKNTIWKIKKLSKTELIELKKSCSICPVACPKWIKTLFKSKIKFKQSCILKTPLKKK